MLTLSVHQPVDVLPPGDGALHWVLTDLHPGPPPHLHQLTHTWKWHHMNVKITGEESLDHLESALLSESLPYTHSPARVVLCR